MAFDSGLVARIADVLQQIGTVPVRQKNVFGGRGFLVGKSTFAIAWESDLLVKAARAEYPELLREPGVAPFAPDGEKAMSSWLVVSADSIAEDPELEEWLRRGIRGIGR